MSEKEAGLGRLFLFAKEYNILYNGLIDENGCFKEKTEGCV